MSKRTALPSTIGELRQDSRYSPARLTKRSVKDEMREHLAERLRAKEVLFPGIVGYDDTVIPQLVNAVLSRHNFILLGLRGQAKSRILRALTTLLDETTPYIAGCEIRDNPYAPLCKPCRERIAAQGDATPIAWLPREDRYVEKLATPDVTVADLIGDLDPIKAARSGEHLSSEMNIHYGLLPRANRGIFALNELPDLAGKIQVALFNVMQEGDVQIKGYPVRLALDVALIFSANPEDYTARGKIVTPLKDRIGSEIRTHYPMTIGEGIAITTQEAWTERGLMKTEIPGYIRSIVEQIAFAAREDKKVDRRSGVSQRLPISTIELVVSNAERRALQHGELLAVPRAGDLYSALPGITGKIELEYEGEMRGSETVVRELVRGAIAQVFDQYFADTNTQQIEQWFNLGGTVKVEDDQPAAAMLKELRQIQGLIEKLTPLGIGAKDSPERIVSAAEFLLEGMVAHRRISRNEERTFTASEKNARRAENFERGGERNAGAREELDDWPPRRSRKVYN
jgi:magnesium chelatase subunit I